MRRDTAMSSFYYKRLEPKFAHHNLPLLKSEANAAELKLVHMIKIIKVQVFASTC